MRAAVLALPLALTGCRPVEKVEVIHVSPQAPVEHVRTPQGIPVMRPIWVDPEGWEKAAAEIDAFASVLRGWTVVIHEPGAFYVPGSPTGLATGQVIYELSEVHLAWRACGQETRLPALQHEVGHITGGPGAGH